ncbi:hypothetical protein SLEP1_g18974 [Rubroshorea leprosula]|uniref:SWIM-type domain-containing protein n=1 Tax=Rubroshorea leprosula TaxID=152421 RepID=A0AAV5J6W1_9ROSI|nr:hypothetical protein SLEP1_g18974 [Rubroshorea leprosula]
MDPSSKSGEKNREGPKIRDQEKEEIEDQGLELSDEVVNEVGGSWSNEEEENEIFNDGGGASGVHNEVGIEDLNIVTIKSGMVELVLDVPNLSDNKDEETIEARTILRNLIASQGKPRTENEQSESIVEVGSSSIAIGVVAEIDNGAFQSDDDVSYITTSDEDDSEAEHGRRRKAIHPVFRENEDWPVIGLGMIFIIKEQFKKAIDELSFKEGASKAEYGMLFNYANELRSKDPEANIVLHAHRPTADVNPTFIRMYVCFSALKKGFLVGCRRIIGVDGAFLKCAHKRELLTAIGRDANNQMFLIAWLVVEGLIQAVKEIFPYVEHRFCARHKYCNFRKKNKGKALQIAFWKTVARRGFIESEFVDDFGPKIWEKIVANVHVSKRCRLIWPGGNNYEVMEDGTNGFVVDLENRKCTCKSRDLIRIPCKHAVTVINATKQKVEDYVAESSNPLANTKEQVPNSTTVQQPVQQPIQQLIPIQQPVQQLPPVQQLALVQQPSKRDKLPIRRSSSSKVAQTPPLDGTLSSEATLVPSGGDTQTPI